MKLSTRSRYGLRFVVYLGCKYGKGAVRLNRIAGDEKISEKYLEQIVTHLKTAGLIESVRGNRGGYKLKRAPGEINLMEIITCLEGKIKLVDCGHKNRGGCEFEEMCPTKDIWNNLDLVISDYLSSITLSELVKTYNRKRQHPETSPLMYHI